MLHAIDQEAKPPKRMRGATQAPAIEPKLVKAVTSSTLPAGLVQKAFMSSSLRKACKSPAVGSATFNWTYPANQPAAKAGFSEVMGDARAAVRMARGWPRASKHAKAAQTAFAAVHTVKNSTQSTPELVETTMPMTAIMISGNAQGRNFITRDGEGRSIKCSMSVDFDAVKWC